MFHDRGALGVVACAFLVSIFIIPCIELFSLGSRVLDLQSKTEQLRAQVTLAHSQLEEIAAILARAKALDQAFLTGSIRRWASPGASAGGPELASL